MTSFLAALLDEGAHNISSSPMEQTLPAWRIGKTPLTPMQGVDLAAAVDGAGCIYMHVSSIYTAAASSATSTSQAQYSGSKTYCWCAGADEGDMIACESETCPEQNHFPLGFCVSPPQSK